MSKVKQQTIIQLLLVIGIIIFINFISVNIFTRLDLTSSKSYSLSETSKILVSSLDDKFLVKVYFTADLPAPYNSNRRLLKDQLDDYRAYSNNNFQYEFIDPSAKPEIEQEAQRYGIPPVQVQVVKNDKLQIEKAYMGLVFLYGDKQEQIPVIQNLDKLEYEISSRIKKLTSGVNRKIGFSTGHGEPSLDDMKQMRQLLSEQYEIEQVSFENLETIPDDIEALIIAAPKQSFSDSDKYLIDQYIMRGGKTAFFINKIDANLQEQMAKPIDLNLDDLLESYGIRLNNNLVRDARCANVTIAQQTGYMTIQSQIPYPYIPVASEFNPGIIAMKNLSPVMFHFVSSIDTGISEKKGLTYTVMLTSSNKSGIMEGPFLINPTQQFTQEMFTESYIPLAVAVEGTFRSLFSEKDLVSDIGNFNTSTSTKIAVVGDGDFFQDMYAGTKDNLIFANNLIDWLVDDIGLSTIRTKDLAVKPLDEVSDGTKTFVKALNLIAPPLFIVIFGIVRWRLRIQRRKQIEMTP